MRSITDVFLDQFESRFRSPIIEFAKHISASDADILVFMARKAACLFHCFEDVRLAQTNRPCTSDMALEGDLSWAVGRRVELVDDTLITGTTLYRASEKLLAAGAQSVTTTVFCVDRQNWSKELVTPSLPYLVLEPHDVTSFSTQAVRALGVIPRPYSVDYPLYGGIRLRGKTLDTIISPMGWILDDVTTPSQSAAGVTSITMVPPKNILRELDQILGWAVSDASQLCKIRLYTRQRGGVRPIHSARVLPIVAFDPLSHEQVDVLWQCLESNVGTAFVPAGIHLRTPSERLRLIQFFIAAKLFTLWLRDVRAANRNSRISPRLDHRQIAFAFSPLVRQYVLMALASDAAQPLGGTPKFIAFPAPVRPVFGPESRFTGSDLPGVQAKLTELLADLYIRRELPARDLVRRHGKSVFQKEEYRDLVNRLSQGVSLPEFRAALADLKNSEAIRSLVSTFMDEAVDRGIAVPITVDDGSTVYRAYRHGEDIKFTEVEARLICIMLKEFATTLQISVIPRVVVEKLIVLLIRAGLQQGYLERWLGTLGDRRSAGVRFYLQGAVAQIGPDRRPYHLAPGDSLTALLKGWGFLRRRSESGYEVARLPERPPTTTATEGQARALGAVLGLVLTNIEPRQRDEELTLIASCLSPVDLAAALTAEVHIFAKHWSYLAVNLTSEEVSRRDAERMLRVHDVYLAVNNGLWKLRRSIAKIPERTLNEWRMRAYSTPNGVLASVVIDSAFPPSGETAENRQFENYLATVGLWLVDVNRLFRELRILLLKSANSDQALSTTRASANTTRRIAKLEEQVERLKVDWERQIFLNPGEEQLLLPLPDPEATGRLVLSEVIGQLDRAAATANSLLDRADALITPFGKPRPFHIYRHLLAIRISGSSTEQCELIRDRLVLAIRTFIIGSTGVPDAADLLVLDHAGQAWHCDIAVGAGGPFSRQWLIRLACEAHRALGESPVHLQCTMWIDLEADDQITRAANTTEVAARNLQQRAEAFRDHNTAVDVPWSLQLLTSAGASALDVAFADYSANADIALRRLPVQIVESNTPYPRRFEMLTIHGEAKATTVRGQADVGIITIVPEEMHAVINLLKEQGPVRRERRHGALYYIGELASDDTSPHRIVATQQLKQGNRSVIAAYDRLMESFQPTLVVLLGIAGSIHKDARIGDVVIADSVIWYEQATIDETMMRFKGEATELAAELRVLINDFFANRGYPYELTTASPDGRGVVHLHMGPIGTGEKVVRYREAPVREMLHDFNYKTLALETEAGGLAQVFYESGLTLRHSARAYLVVRGISDHADAAKDDRWRAEAASNACAALKEVLNSFPTLSTVFQVHS